MKIFQFYKTYQKYFSFVLFFICFSIISLEIYNNINFITSLIVTNFHYVCLILLLQFLFYFIYNCRTYFSYKFFLKKNIEFKNWTYFFFKSLIYNNLLNFLGTIYRAILLKKIGISYVRSTGILYLLYFSYLFVNFFLIVLGILFFTDMIIKEKFFFLLFLITLSSFIYFFHDVIVFLCKKKFSKISAPFIKEFLFLKKYFKKSLSNNLFLFNLFGNAIILFVIELFIFYFAFSIFFVDYSYSNIFLLFVIAFILDKIPFINNIIGLNEILYGLIFTNVGLDFYQGVVIKFICRITGIVTLITYYLYILIFIRGNKLA